MCRYSLYKLPFIFNSTAFLIVLKAFLGVNYILDGMHSYTNS
ncbi:unknown [Bacteroides sp. CAG:754]|nr:unknown [Bacteroides sp. CAG:754]